ncbi:hypothetical protein Nmel_017253, partial [Mimus melanotis]
SQPAWKLQERSGCINSAGSYRLHRYRGSGSTGEQLQGLEGARREPGGSQSLHHLWQGAGGPLVPGASFTSALCSHRSRQHSGWRRRRPPLSWFSLRSQVRWGASRWSCPGAGMGSVPAVLGEWDCVSADPSTPCRVTG